MRVAVLTNSLAATDVAGVHAGYSKYRGRLLAGGVELYEMKSTAVRDTDRKGLSLTGSSQASLHTKAVTVDGRWTFIGSMNLDPRSITINTEMGALLESEELASQMAGQFARTTAPELSYAVRLVDGRLRWSDREHGREHGREQLFDREPEASLGRRATAALLRLLPIESQLQSIVTCLGVRAVAAAFDSGRPQRRLRPDRALQCPVRRSSRAPGHRQTPGART